MPLETVSIESNIQSVHRRIAAACGRAGRPPEAITLVAVSKGMDSSLVEAAYGAGLRHFGENRVQEAAQKIPRLAPMPGITWHMVGHLQSNKVKQAVELFQIIHSVDSVPLAEAVSRHALQLSPGQVPVPILLQVNMAGEATKQGFPPGEVLAAFQAISRLPHLAVRGLMTIAPLVTNPEEVRPVFRRLRQLRDALGLDELSMGMTDDFEVAVEEGATLVRIGRAIFGPRTY